jgi:hypothetical protein
VISLAVEREKVLFHGENGGGGSVRKNPPRPIFGSISFPEGNIPKGANILRFKEGFKESSARDRIERGIPQDGVFPDSDLLSITWNPSKCRSEEIMRFQENGKNRRAMSGFWRGI